MNEWKNKTRGGVGSVVRKIGKPWVLIRLKLKPFHQVTGSYWTSRLSCHMIELTMSSSHSCATLIRTKIARSKKFVDGRNWGGVRSGKVS